MKAQIVVPINWDPDGTGIGADLPGPNALQIDIEVNDGDEPITVVFTAEGLSMTTKHEPKLITKLITIPEGDTDG